MAILKWSLRVFLAAYVNLLFIYPSIASSAILCSQVLYDKAAICSVTGGCKINWKEHIDSGTVRIRDESGVPSTIPHRVYSKESFFKDIEAIDQQSILKDRMSALYRSAKLRDELMIQYIVIGSRSNSMVFETSQVISARQTVSPEALNSAFGGAWGALTHAPDYTGFYTVVMLIAEPSRGHPIHYAQRSSAEELFEKIVIEQGGQRWSPNKVWAIKMTEDLGSGKEIVFLYDPGST